MIKINFICTVIKYKICDLYQLTRKMIFWEVYFIQEGLYKKVKMAKEETQRWCMIAYMDFFHQK